MIAEYKFGPWLPEQTDYKNPGLEECKNAIPSPSGYQPAYGLVSLGAEVDGDIIGGASFDRADGTPVIMIATTEDIYVVAGSASTTSYVTYNGLIVTYNGLQVLNGPVQFSSSLGLTLATSDYVVFEQFGSAIYATSKSGDTWVLADIESDTAFVAASGNIPHGNAIGRVGDFLAFGDLTDIDASAQPYYVRWSPFNNPTGTWGTDIATQADYQPLDPAQGPVTAISGGTFGFVFQRNGISRMTYVGGKSVFAFNLFEKNRGCSAPRSVLRVGDVAYFLSYDGFFQTDGASVQPISRGRVWEWFKDDANQSFLPYVSGAIDWERRCCVWCYASGDSEVYTKQIWYNWETEMWGYVDQGVQILLSSTRRGLSLEDLDSLYPSLDAMDESLDSPIFKASGKALVAFSGGVLSSLTGSTLEANFITGSAQPVIGKRTFVRGVAPLIANETGGTTVAIGTRDTMTKSYSLSNPVAIGAIGYAPVNSDGRYHRVSITTPAGEQWSDSYGYQLDYAASGTF